MYNRLSIQQKILVIIFLGVLLSAILMFYKAPIDFKSSQEVEETTQTKQENTTILQEGIHYGYINLDSIEELTKKIPNFSSRTRIDRHPFKSTVSINVQRYEYVFFGSDNGEQWWDAYRAEFEKKGITYNKETSNFTMKYKDGYILMPYQVLMQLTLFVENK